MPQSLAKVLVHIIFLTKSRLPYLTDKAVRKEMHAYIGGTYNNLDSPVIIVGGVSEHIHILCRLSRNITIAKLIGDVKRESSKLNIMNDMYGTNHLNI